MQSLLNRPINVNSLLIVIGIVSALAILFAILIIVVSKKCKVKEDEKAKKIEQFLAGANCGGCGFAGCADFANALSSGKANLNSCGATSSEARKEISNILGIPFVEAESKFAVCKCAGGLDCLDKFEYIGNEKCINQNILMGGKKSCATACLGGGDCQNVCINGAIIIENQKSSINKEICISCGACVKACPKHIIELIPKTAKVYVACSSKCKGKEVMSSCKVGCIGCGLCAKNCPNNAIKMIDNLAVIDYSLCTGCGLCRDKCPRKIIKSI